MAIPVAAIAHALEIAAAIASNPESMKKAVELADSATKVITAGAKTAETAAEVVSPVAKKAAAAGAEMGNQVAGAAGKAITGASKRVGGLIDGASSKVRGAKEARVREADLQEARRQVLAGASATLDAKGFEHDWAAAAEKGLPAPLKSPGYYAIATYKGKPGKDGAANYEGIYVGRSDNMGASVHRHLDGGGNPDVYADMKYGKCVRIYAFPDFDDTDDNNLTLQSFCVALGASESYNARKVASGADRVALLVEHDAADALVARLRGVLGDLTVEESELCGDGLVELLARF